MESTAFPWVGHLPESEQLSFWTGLRIALHNTHASLSDPSASDYEAESAPTIAMWKDRAEKYASMSLEDRQQDAARKAASEILAGMMPGIGLADEVADKILTAIRRVD